MGNMTISTIEYTTLRERAEAYERMLEAAQSTFPLIPPETSRKKIIKSLEKTDKYNQKFLISLNRGLKRSSYFKN